MLCPVCNGLRPLVSTCYVCGARLLDEGKWTDWTGPYAPYEPVAFTAETYLSSGEEICKHVGYCPICEDGFEVSVREREL
jgi:hypothetical protein